jgi:hypothetical protein
MALFGRRRRASGRCRRCGRVILLTTQGQLFLHGDRDPVWAKGAKSPDLGDHCPGGMTRDYDPVAAADAKAGAA